MTAWPIFFCGLAGSLAVEVVNIYQILESERGAVPRRYKDPFYWFIRLLLAFIGGGLALGYHVDGLLLAANVGASAPLIIRTFASGIKPQNVPE
jgi:hypothetical protein